MNFKKLRDEEFVERFLYLLNTYDFDTVAPDQDYLNVILRGQILHLDPVWNAEPVKDLPKNVKLVHFNLFNKPWHYKNVPCERIFWNAAKGTGFTGDLRRQQAAFDAEKQKADRAKVEALIKKAGKLAKLKKPIFSE